MINYKFPLICPRGHTGIYLSDVSGIKEKPEKWTTYYANESVTKLSIKQLTLVVKGVDMACNQLQSSILLFEFQITSGTMELIRIQ